MFKLEDQFNQEEFFIKYLIGINNVDFSEEPVQGGVSRYVDKKLG